MKTYIIRLLPYDNYGTAREKLSWSRSQRTLLVWPDKKRIVEKKVELSLILRYCREIGTQLAIVARDEEVVGNARELGLPVFATVREAERSSWKTVRKRDILRKRSKYWVSILNQIRKRSGKPRYPSLESTKLRFLFCCLGVLSFLAVCLIFIPSAKVNLDIPESEQQLTLSVWASPDIKVPNLVGGMPAHQVSNIQTITRSAKASGSMALPIDSARGKVVLVNLTDNLVEVPAGTIVMTVDDKLTRYAIEENVLLSGDKEEIVEAGIKAVRAGSDGNAEAGEIRAVEGPIGLLVMVENVDAVIGGFDRTVTAPTKEDYHNLKEQIIQALQKSSLNGLTPELKPGEKIINETINVKNIIKEIREPAEGQPGDTITLTIEAEVEAWVVNENDVSLVTTMAMDAGLGEGFEAIGDAKIISNSDVTVLDNRRIVWQVLASRRIQPKITVSDLAASIAGKLPSEAKQLIRERYALESDADIFIKPKVWPFLPYLPYQIRIVNQ